MDTVFVSKVSIIAVLYFLTRYVYHQTEWHVRGKRNWTKPIAKRFNNFLNKIFQKDLSDFLIFIYAVFWGIPLLISLVVLGYIILFEGTLKFLDSRNYWEQILICFGFIALYFSIRIYLDGEQVKKLQKDAIIAAQRKTIAELELKILMLEKSERRGQK